MMQGGSAKICIVVVGTADGDSLSRRQNVAPACVGLGLGELRASGAKIRPDKNCHTR